MVTRALAALGLAALGVACTGHNSNFCPGGLEDEDGECPCFGAGRFVFCVRELPTDRREYVDSETIDTTTGCNATFMLDRTDRELCLVQGTEVTISGSVKVMGSRPLVLLGTRTLTIAQTGIVDASGGAGDEPTCDPDRKATSGGPGAGGGMEGGGGGAGGSFGTSGEIGGMGGGGNGGLAGQPADVVASPMLQGGCRGTAGGRINNAPGGAGGGGVYLVAGDMLTIAGAVNASGAGGQGGAIGKAGGGGGGSGGMIVLHAPSVSAAPDAQIFANGGGGGGGGTNADPGMAGGTSAAAKSPATGGPGAGAMNAGGDGAFLVTPPTPGRFGGPAEGGGGGGGGLGVIYVLDGKGLGEAQVSPAPSTPPP